MRTLPRRPMLPVLTLAITTGAFAFLGVGRAAPPVVDAGQADFAGLVDIGAKRRLYLECRGQGEPMVILQTTSTSTLGRPR